MNRVFLRNRVPVLLWMAGVAGVVWLSAPGCYSAKLGAGPPADAPCPVAMDGCDCSPTGRCEQGLQCMSGTCRPVGSDAAAAAASAGGGGGAGSAVGAGGSGAPTSRCAGPDAQSCLCSVYPTATIDCVCDQCWDEAVACANEPAGDCIPIVECCAAAGIDGVSGEDCYGIAACRDLIEQAGGSNPSIDVAIRMADCAANRCK